MPDDETQDVAKLELLAVHELVVQVRALVEAHLAQAPVVTRVLEAEARRGELENERRAEEKERAHRWWTLLQDLAASAQVRWAGAAGVFSVLVSLSALIASWAGVDVVQLLSLIPGG